MDRKFFYCFTFLLFYLFTPSTVMAQGMVTEIKVIAVNWKDSIRDAAQGYNGYRGSDDMDLDFRKGRGGGYVFALHKKSKNTKKYITGVRVEKRDAYGKQFNDGSKLYTPVLYFQETTSHYKGNYYGGLNGRDYGVYGGDYKKQDHIYVTRSGNDDFNERVLKDFYVTATKPSNLASNQTWSGGHAGGGRYIVYTWHNHEPKYRTVDINNHERYCERDQCGVTHTESHRFEKLYGYDAWKQFGLDEKDAPKQHYKKCLDCGQIVTEPHKFATYTSNWKDHSERCLICDYVIEAEHKNFGRQKIPVDEYNHMIFCADCGFLAKFPHVYNDDRFVVRQECERTVVRYTCKQCYHQAYFEEAGLGHDFDQYGLCKRKNCLHPYQMPGVEKLANGDSTYVVKTFGHLYWIADYVNNRRPKTRVRLDNDLVADSLMRLSWRPIGSADSTAFQGVFDGGGHVITMLQTETPVSGCGYRGLFGAIGKDATVRNVKLSACNMRGWDYIGGLAGVNEGTIDSCQVSFSVMNSIGSGMNIGGICGLNKGTISNCSTEHDVWVGGVRDYAGGICGTNRRGRLTGNVSKAICGSGSDAVLPESASDQ